MIVGDWIVIRHQAAIAGRVTDLETGKAVGGALVEIIERPPPFDKWLGFKQQEYGARWSMMAERPDRAVTQADGHYHFLDLPDGRYGLVYELLGIHGHVAQTAGFDENVGECPTGQFCLPL